MAGAGSGLDPALRCAVEGQRAFFARLREQGAAAPRADDAAPSRMIAVGPPLDGGLDFRTPGGDAGASAQLFAGGVLPAAGAAGSAVGGDGDDGGKRLTSGGLDVCGGNGGDGAGGGGLATVVAVEVGVGTLAVAAAERAVKVKAETVSSGAAASVAAVAITCPAVERAGTMAAGMGWVGWATPAVRDGASGRTAPSRRTGAPLSPPPPPQAKSRPR